MANESPEVLWPTSEEEMLKIQKEDLILGPIIMNLLRKQPLVDGMTKSYKIDQRRSYHLKQLDEGKIGALRLFDKEKPNLIRTALPSKLIEQTLLMYHDQHGL